jgi:hypothetical protein
MVGGARSLFPGVSSSASSGSKEDVYYAGMIILTTEHAFSIFVHELQFEEACNKGH